MLLKIVLLFHIILYVDVNDINIYRYKVIKKKADYSNGKL